MATADGKTLSSNLGNLGGCQLGDGYCQTDEFTVIWLTRNLLDSYCPYKLKGNFTAIGNDKFITINALQSSFTIEDTSIHQPYIPCLPRNVVFTREHAALVFVQPNVKQQTSGKNSSNRTNPNRSMQDLISLLKEGASADSEDPKLEFLNDFLEADLEERFDLVHYHFCRMARDSALLSLSLIRLDPTIGFRHLLGGENIAAVPVGDVYIVSECRKVTAEYIYPTHKVPGFDDCFTFLPVKIANHTQLFFSAGAGWRDLFPHSPRTPCPEVSRSILEVDSSPTGQRRFVDDKGPVQVTEIYPSVFKWNESYTSKRHLIFDSPKLYNSIVSIPRAILNVYSSQLPGMTEALKATVAYTSELSLRPGIVKEAIEGSAKAVGILANASSAYVDSAFKRVEGGVAFLSDHILSPMLTAVVTFAVCGLGFVFVLYAGYSSFKRRRKFPFHSSDGHALAKSSDKEDRLSARNMREFKLAVLKAMDEPDDETPL